MRRLVSCAEASAVRGLTTASITSGLNGLIVFVRAAPDRAAPTSDSPSGISHWPYTSPLARTLPAGEAITLVRPVVSARPGKRLNALPKPAASVFSLLSRGILLTRLLIGCATRMPATAPPPAPRAVAPVIFQSQPSLVPILRCWDWAMPSPASSSPISSTSSLRRGLAKTRASALASTVPLATAWAAAGRPATMASRSRIFSISARARAAIGPTNRVEAPAE